jgi:hypothetical protein
MSTSSRLERPRSLALLQHVLTHTITPLESAGDGAWLVGNRHDALMHAHART